MYHLIRCQKHLSQADVAELVDALDLGSSISDVRVRVSPTALKRIKKSQCIALALFDYQCIYDGYENYQSPIFCVIKHEKYAISPYLIF